MSENDVSAPSKMQSKLLKRGLFYIAIFIIFILVAIFTRNSQDGDNGCYLRYPAKDGKTYGISYSNSLNANGNYSSVNLRDQNQLVTDGGAYGQWKNIGVNFEGEIVRVTVTGRVVLCQSYLAKNNSSEKIPIPFVGSSDYLTIPIFANSTNPSDGDLMEVVGPHENILIKISPPYTEINEHIHKTRIIGKSDLPNQVEWLNSIENRIEKVDCGGLDKHPACGVYQPGILGSDTCYFNNVNFPVCGSAKCYYWSVGFKVSCGIVQNKLVITDNKILCDIDRCKKNCSIDNGIFGSKKEVTNTHENKSFYDSVQEIKQKLTRTDLQAKQILLNTYPNSVTGNNPAIIKNPYQNSTILPYSDNSDFYTRNIPFSREECLNIDTRSSSAKLPDSVTNSYKTWLDYGKGLILEYKSRNNQVISKQIENLGNFSQTRGIPIGTIGYPTTIKASLAKNPAASNQTGGYLLSLQHDKCVRMDGKGQTDAYVENRGAIEYIWVPSNFDPNRSTFDEINERPRILLPEGDSDNYVVSPPISSTNLENQYQLWMRIKNKPEDYKDSKGKYNLDILNNIRANSFVEKIINPITRLINSSIQNISNDFFASMTCYGKTDKSNCYDFFAFVRFALTIYVMIFGFNFLIGKVEFNLIELVQLLIKVIIIAGLINGSTFELFRDYIYPLVIEFADEILKNAAGSDHPFGFIDDIGSYIFFSPIFIVQIMSLYSISYLGLFYIAMILLSVFFFARTIFYALSVYFMSKMLLGALLGFAPLFLICILFPLTKEIFESWVSTLFQYIIEPILLVLGFIVFASLFELMLDQILDFSVCIKCIFPFKIPLSFFNDSLADIYLFCLPWFGAWGMDLDDTYSLSIPDLLTLLLISFMGSNYVNMASSIAQSLAGGAGVVSSQVAHRVSTGGAVHSVANNVVAATEFLDNKLGNKFGGKTGAIVGGITKGLRYSAKALSAVAQINTTNSNQSAAGKTLSGAFTIGSAISDINKIKKNKKLHKQKLQRKSQKNDDTSFDDNDDSSASSEAPGATHAEKRSTAIGQDESSGPIEGERPTATDKSKDTGAGSGDEANFDDQGKK